MASTHTQTELAGLLSQNLGAEKALEVVRAAAMELGLPVDLTQKQALEILEKIAATPGLIGITARFAKSRVLLRWSD